MFITCFPPKQALKPKLGRLADGGTARFFGKTLMLGNKQKARPD